jgi:fucose 4-O-acetylase-like acetyltransferase
MGYLLKRTKILYPTDNKIKDFFIMFGAFLGATLFVVLCDDTPVIGYFKNKIEYGNPFQIYSCAALFVIGVLLLCKFISHLPYISWLGRYSIIVLVTHLQLNAITATLLYKIHGLPLLLHHCVNFLIVITLMSIVIPFCKKYLPYITAQKDIILINRIAS